MKNNYNFLMLGLTKSGLKRLNDFGIKYHLIDRFGDMYDLSISDYKVIVESDDKFVVITFVNSTRVRLHFDSNEFNRLIIQ